jgi:hypothetical protein
MNYNIDMEPSSNLPFSGYGWAYAYGFGGNSSCSPSPPGSDCAGICAIGAVGGLPVAGPNTQTCPGSVDIAGGGMITPPQCRIFLLEP